MRIEIALTAGEACGFEALGKTAVVFDVLRATSTIATALANGGKGVVPVTGLEEAGEILARHRDKSFILGGERGGLKMEGCQFGNSPLEYPPEIIAGKYLVLTTSNGTRAIRNVQGSRRVLTCSLLNLSATAEAVSDLGCDILLACAGANGAVSLEDTFAAGLIIDLICKRTAAELTDAGIMALELACRYRANPTEVMRLSSHGRWFEKKGLSEDLKWCSRLDLYNFYCILENGIIVRKG